jgi:hypothetical protein
MRKQILVLGMILMVTLSFNLPAQAETYYGADADQIASSIERLGHSQDVYRQFQTLENNLISQGHKPDGITNVSLNLVSSNGNQRVYTFEIQHSYSGKSVTHANGRIFIHEPNLTLIGEAHATCGATGQECEVTAAKFNSVKQEVREIPPVGGSISSAGGRD